MSLRPQKRTFDCNAISVAMGQFLPRALQHIRGDSAGENLPPSAKHPTTALFDHLVCGRKQRLRNGEAERLRSF
jgi:hypothetical protein